MPRRDRFLLDPLGDFREVAWLAEVFVNACESYVGDMVERLEAGHDRLADAGRGNLVADRFPLPLHTADQLVDLGGVDVALAAGVADGALKLGAVERLALGIF